MIDVLILFFAGPIICLGIGLPILKWFQEKYGLTTDGDRIRKALTHNDKKSNKK